MTVTSPGDNQQTCVSMTQPKLTSKLSEVPYITSVSFDNMDGSFDIGLYQKAYRNGIQKGEMGVSTDRLKLVVVGHKGCYGFLPFHTS